MGTAGGGDAYGGCSGADGFTGALEVDLAGLDDGGGGGGGGEGRGVWEG